MASEARVLVVAKTRMHSMACVGGLSLDNSQGMRLLRADGANQSLDTAFEVGDIWDISYEPRAELEPPHIEDVCVMRGRKVGEQLSLRAFLLEHVTRWRGGPHRLFDGLLSSNSNAHWYLGRSVMLPRNSTGFWISDRGLTRHEEYNKALFVYHDPDTAVTCKLPYVGLAPSMVLTQYPQAR